jgi:epoxyqueuosine reductase
MCSSPGHIDSLTTLIKSKALELGFDACGVAKAESVEPTQKEKFSLWLQKRYNGAMGYIANYFEKRMDPCQLVPGARSVISLAINYHQKNFQHHDSHYKISQYAAGEDYHHVIKRKLYSLMELVVEKQPDINFRVFTDSAPVAERYWAQKAGLGRTGKNSCLIIPRKGSYFFLAEIITDLELKYDEPYKKDLCGKCTRCIEACPTGAITEPGEIDARKCISYLTIELKGDIPDEYHPYLNRFIFGCDICQEVCPHNLKFASQTREESFSPLPAIRDFTRVDWEKLEKAQFRKNFVKKRSPFVRAGFEKLKTNIGFAGEKTGE